MTPDERREARGVVSRMVTLAGLFASPEDVQFLVRSMKSALEQIGDDEGLMRQALDALIDLGACDDSECREPNCLHIVCALRARLGEPAPEEPKP